MGAYSITLIEIFNFKNNIRPVFLVLYLGYYMIAFYTPRSALHFILSHRNVKCGGKNRAELNTVKLHLSHYIFTQRLFKNQSLQIDMLNTRPGILMDLVLAFQYFSVFSLLAGFSRKRGRRYTTFSV